MSYDPAQLREVIRCSLEEFDPKVNSPAAVELLMLTAAAESDLGTYLYQINGPALGTYQIDPTTYRDVLYRIIVPRQPTFTVRRKEALIYDLRLSTIVARMVYWPHPQPLPKADDIPALARYYKKYFNTDSGKSSVRNAIQKYERYC